MPEYAIERDPLLADERPGTLAKRVETVLQSLAAASEKPCVRCSRPVCAHDALASLVLGHPRDPQCTDCLATESMRDARVFRDQVTSFVLSKECLAVGWRWAGVRDPACAWSDTAAGRNDDASQGGADTAAPGSAVAPAHDSEWNAGDLACGELLLELRQRLRAMSPGGTIKVTALDSAAPVDMPAWCRLTGHALVHARHPYYFIRRKED
jgi:tRNA 2-thiouridine synthesizing protein A